MIMKLIIILLITTNVLADNYVFEIDELPEIEFMPTLANGHLGAVILYDKIFVNGLYNGFSGFSHRAAIPNFGNIQFQQCNNITVEPKDNCKYSLNIRDGIFEIVYSGAEFSVKQKIYAHRYFVRAFVNQITIERNEDSINTNPITISLYQTDGYNVTEDITFITQEQISLSRFKIVGLTRQVEHSGYQPEKRNVSVYYDNVPPTITLASNEQEKTYTYILGIGFTDEEVTDDLTELDRYVAAENHQAILQIHTDYWHKIWQEMDISVIGNDHLDSVIHSSMFFLFSSLPSLNTSQPRNMFYGLSPSGLAKGEELRDYQGHSFWDTEIWMQPAVLLFEPKWSEELLHYRYVLREVAANNARETGFSGLRYPWESGYTGIEVTPPCCPEVVEYQHHITGDIAFAARLHLFATHDFTWLKNEGCELAYRTAEFWESHVEFNENLGLYEIKRIMGPDEDELDGVDNNGYTNVIAGYNLYFGEFASCVCSGSDFHPNIYEKFDDWSKIARNIRLVYDDELDYNPQHDAFELTPDREIKQADTILMGYPLQYQMKTSTKRNNLHTYANITRDDGPAMTWSMHVIGHLDVDEITEATNLFNRSFIPYLKPPFNIWSEAMDGVAGVGNFLTGAGGFLQLILNGYGGIRLNMDYMTISRTHLPPSTTNFKINAIKYLQSVFQIIVTPEITTVQITKMGDITLSITKNDINLSFDEMEIYELESSDILTIRPSTDAFDGCKIPDNIIGGGSITFKLCTLNIIAALIIFIINQFFIKL